MDKDTEWKVLQNLKKMNTKTIICISHTAAGVACCDRVVEIENKKFKEGMASVIRNDKIQFGKGESA